MKDAQPTFWRLCELWPAIYHCLSLSSSICHDYPQYPVFFWRDGSTSLDFYVFFPGVETAIAQAGGFEQWSSSLIHLILWGVTTKLKPPTGIETGTFLRRNSRCKRSSWCFCSVCNCFTTSTPILGDRCSDHIGELWYRGTSWYPQLGLNSPNELGFIPHFQVCQSGIFGTISWLVIALVDPL